MLRKLVSITLLCSVIATNAHAQKVIIDCDPGIDDAMAIILGIVELSGMKIPKGMLDVQEDKMKKWKFVIDSMTLHERGHPEEIKHSRVQRIARGSGCSEKDVRELFKYFKQTKKIMKMTKGGKGLKRGPLAKFAKQFGLQA